MRRKWLWNQPGYVLNVHSWQTSVALGEFEFHVALHVQMNNQFWKTFALSDYWRTCLTGRKISLGAEYLRSRRCGIHRPSGLLGGV